jgi:nucleoside-diphosphate-sugar epimerase
VRILIAGASGNLGSLLVQHLLRTSHELRLLIHKSPLPFDIVEQANVSVVRADLADASTLKSVCTGVDCVVYVAGVLFTPLPEKVLPKTNVEYVKNLLFAAREAQVGKFILVSFPHVEGETDPDHPATGRLDATPAVVHFRTRLEAERLVLTRCRDSAMVPVVFRAGIVYGKEVKLIRAAKWLLQHHLLAVWKKPTWAHFIALPDFLAALQAAIELDTAKGIYQVCDDHPVTLQEFLDALADHCRCGRPWRLPAWMFHAAGIACEAAALLLGTAAQLNRDIIRAGMTSCVADNFRMKSDLLPMLAYPSFERGVSLL